MTKYRVQLTRAESKPFADTKPIAFHIDALRNPATLPERSIAACVARIAEAGPLLRAAISAAAEGGELSDGESMLIFRSLPILAATRDRDSFQPFLRMMRSRSHERLELFGDMMEDMGRYIASLFDDDVESLFAAISDRAIDEYFRYPLFGAATFLTWDGRIARERMRAFLVHFDDARLADPEDYGWIGWQESITMLGFGDLAPRFERAWDDGRIGRHVMGAEHFRQDLARTEASPPDIARFEAAHLGYVDDAVEDLAWTRPKPEKSVRPTGISTTVTNKMRNVGRNDPCPCGSGKKAKKCCLSA